MKSAYKRLFFLIMTILLVCGSTGCGRRNEVQTNLIGPKELTAEQKEIIDLVTTNTLKYEIFDLQTSAKFKEVNFWFETYEYGIMTKSEPLAEISISFDCEKQLNGAFVLVIEQAQEYKWTLLYNDAEGNKVRSLTEIFDANKSVAKASDTIDQFAEVLPEKEIVLYACVFSEQPIIETFSVQGLSVPESLELYEFAGVLKCSFKS